MPKKVTRPRKDPDPVPFTVVTATGTQTYTHAEHSITGDGVLVVTDAADDAHVIAAYNLGHWQEVREAVPDAPPEDDPAAE